MNINGFLTELYAADTPTEFAATGGVTAIGYGHRSTWEPALQIEPFFCIKQDDWDALKKEVAELRCLVEELMEQQLTQMGDIQDVL